jgi:glycosyltransferase involved in cell wall biosynthesis
VTNALRVLLLAPYCGGSHRAWAQGYAAHSRHQIDLVTLPARFWKWRMQGGAVTMAERVRDMEIRPDVLLATDMLNLPAFLALTRDMLSEVPAAIYFHENQLTYPVPPGTKRDLTYAMINWLSMLCADRVLFNSAYHQADWFGALPNLLKHFPDCTHLDRMPAVRQRSAVLPVGCDLARFDEAPPLDRDQAAPLILWNQRWEYDKDPETFFRALDILASEGIAFQVALAGSNVRQMPDEFEAARERLGERVIHYGRADAERYARLLQGADIVVSTAIHEFFGVAMVEAMYCGCFPLLPRRLAYPEILPQEHGGRCLYDTFEELVEGLRWAVTHWRERGQIAEALQRAMGRFEWKEVGPRYDEVLMRTTMGG